MGKATGFASKEAQSEPRSPRRVRQVSWEQLLHEALMSLALAAVLWVVRANVHHLPATWACSHLSPPVAAFLGPGERQAVDQSQASYQSTFRPLQTCDAFHTRL